MRALTCPGGGGNNSRGTGRLSKRINDIIAGKDGDIQPIAAEDFEMEIDVLLK